MYIACIVDGLFLCWHEVEAGVLGLTGVGVFLAAWRQWRYNRRNRRK